MIFTLFHASVHRTFVEVQHLLPCSLAICAWNMNPITACWKQVNQVQISIFASIANWAAGHIMTSLPNCLIQCKSRLKPEVPPDPILAKTAISLFPIHNVTEKAKEAQCILLMLNFKCLTSSMCGMWAQFELILKRSWLSFLPLLISSGPSRVFLYVIPLRLRSGSLKIGHIHRQECSRGRTGTSAN